MVPMSEPDVVIRREGNFATVTMNRPQRRNALSLTMLRSLLAAFEQVGDSDALGVVLAGNGPVFSAGHDFADVAGADYAAVRALLRTCTDLMRLMQPVDLDTDEWPPSPRPRRRRRRDQL